MTSKKNLFRSNTELSAYGATDNTNLRDQIRILNETLGELGEKIKEAFGNDIYSKLKNKNLIKKRIDDYKLRMDAILGFDPELKTNADDFNRINANSKREMIELLTIEKIENECKASNPVKAAFIDEFILLSEKILQSEKQINADNKNTVSPQTNPADKKLERPRG